MQRAQKGLHSAHLKQLTQLEDLDSVLRWAPGAIHADDSDLDCPHLGRRQREGQAVEGVHRH